MGSPSPKVGASSGRVNLPIGSEIEPFIEGEGEASIMTDFSEIEARDETSVLDETTGTTT